MPKTPKRGRPKKEQSEELFPNRLTIAIDDLMLKELKDYAKFLDRSTGWIVRQAIDEYLTKSAHQKGAQTDTKTEQ